MMKNADRFEMNLIEVMKQALEALDYIYATSDDQQEKKIDAISALRAAIEEAEKQEPVAWFVQYKDSHEFVFGKKPLALEALSVEPLYTHPAPAVPGGWQLVPKEPTLKMIDAGADVDPEHESVWQVMLAAAPKFGEKNG